jgi:hypothetical protein
VDLAEEHDEACQVVSPTGTLGPRPSAAVNVVLHQRRMFNELAEQALACKYDHDRSRVRGRIGDAAWPVLDAMRRDLGTA